MMEYCNHPGSTPIKGECLLCKQDDEITALKAELAREKENIDMYRRAVVHAKGVNDRLRADIKWLREFIKYHLRAYGQRKINADQLEAELWELIEGK